MIFFGRPAGILSAGPGRPGVGPAFHFGVAAGVPSGGFDRALRRRGSPEGSLRRVHAGTKRLPPSGRRRVSEKSGRSGATWTHGSQTRCACRMLLFVFEAFVFYYASLCLVVYHVYQCACSGILPQYYASCHFAPSPFVEKTYRLCRG